MTSALPRTMHGVQITEKGGIEVLKYIEDLPVPSLKDGEVLVKNDFAGINFIDTYFRSGLYPFPTPGVLGLEAAGTVVSIGSGETFGLQVGDKVAYMGSGTYASYTAVGALLVYKLPPGLETDIGAATFLQGLTALTLIREAHYAKSGEWILVHAAAGGTGQWLCRLLYAVGARVIGTASTEAKRALAKESGAEHVLEYGDELVKKVMEITGGQGVAAVYDGIGKDTFEIDFELLARKGSLVSFGNASGPVPPFSPLKLSGKNIRLSRPRLQNSVATRKELDFYSKELFGLMQSHSINVKIHKKYALKDVAEAHQDLEGRKTTGKLLLQI